MNYNSIGAGLKVLEIKNVTKSVSKQGNDMFVWTMTDENGKDCTIYTVKTGTPSKDFMLKQVLKAMGIVKNEEGKYLFNINDIRGKKVLGDFYLDSNTNEVKLKGFLAYSENQDMVIEWEQHQEDLNGL